MIHKLNATAQSIAAGTQSRAFFIAVIQTAEELHPFKGKKFWPHVFSFYGW